MLIKILTCSLMELSRPPTNRVVFDGSATAVLSSEFRLLSLYAYVSWLARFMYYSHGCVIVPVSSWARVCSRANLSPKYLDNSDATMMFCEFQLLLIYPRVCRWVYVYFCIWPQAGKNTVLVHKQYGRLRIVSFLIVEHVGFFLRLWTPNLQRKILKNINIYL